MPAMKRCALLALLLAVMAGTSTTAQKPANPRFDALVALAEAKMREYRIPGVSIGILDNGVITARGLGVTNVNEPLAVSEETVFPIASISKTFAATMMMRLVEQGRVDLKAPVRKYLPDFKVRDENVSRDVTIWNLLTHTAGWEGQVSGPERGEDTLRNFTATVMPDLMQIAPPTAAWSYNNAGFSVSGRVIEAVTGTSINRAIFDLVFQPLGLKHAGTTAGDFIVHRFAAGHVNRGNEPAGMIRPFSPSVSVTAGGVGLCMMDLLAYAKFHLGDGTAPSGDRLLGRASLELMRTTQLHKQSTDDDIGIAWHLRNVGPLRVAAHGGTLGGHILLLELVPERNFAIGILTNSSNGWRLIQDVEREALRSLPRRDVPEEPCDRASRTGRDAAKRRATGHAARSGAVCRTVSEADERGVGSGRERQAGRAGDSQHRRSAPGDADRVLRPRSRGDHGRQRSRPVD